MTPRKGKKVHTTTNIGDLAITHRHAAGIDVHSAVHFVAVPAEDVPAGFINRTRSCRWGCGSLPRIPRTWKPSPDG